MPSLPGPWVVKPDDGAGCDGLERLDGFVDAQARLRSSGGRLVAQPWIDGEAWSLSLLCAGGRTCLLGCNRQRLTWRAGRLHLDRLMVNAQPPADPRVGLLGADVAGAIPGLWGYVGVDFLLGAEGPLVIDVNPRLTTSYCGLPAALGRNVAAMVVSSDAPIRFPLRHHGRGKWWSSISGPNMPPDAIIGWDLGGAHSRRRGSVRRKRVERVAQLPVPSGAAWPSCTPRWTPPGPAGDRRLHAVTMTGEMADLFPTRAEGVRALVGDGDALRRRAPPVLRYRRRLLLRR